MLPMTCKNESVILVSSKSRSLCEGLLFLCEKIGGGIERVTVYTNREIEIQWKFGCDFSQCKGA
jgi:hypothetical protein